MGVSGTFNPMLMSSGSPPIFIGAGAWIELNSSTPNNIVNVPQTLALPSGIQVNDYLVVIYQVSSFDDSSSSLPTLNSISGSGTTPRTKVAGDFYYGTAPTITVHDPSAYILGICLAFRGVNSSSPIDTTGSGSLTAVVGTNTIPNPTASENNSYLLDVVAHNLSTNSSALFSAWANTSLDSITELGERSTLIQDDGGFAFAGGVKKEAGAANNTTFSLTNNSGNFRYLTMYIRGK